jgi:nicotinamide mononucleotide transporter
MNSANGASKSWHRWGEPIAAGLNLLYTIGYLQGHATSFLCAGIGSILFAWICWQRHLRAESALWLFYIGLAVYGYWSVQETWPDPLPVASLQAHAISIAIGLASWIVVAHLLTRTDRSALPGLDAFTTVGSLIASYWMLQFVQANWLYWIVIDIVAIALYWKRGLYWGAALFCLYTLLAIEGWFDLIPPGPWL